MKPEDLQEFREILESRGVHAALRYLNARTAHRFTGIYRFDDPMLRNMHLFDRENPELELGADAPMRETYCSMVGMREEPLRIEDARTDSRTTDHPARESTIAYSGVPLRSRNGTVLGTLCHFDLGPRTAHAEETPFMEAAAQALTERPLFE